MSWKKVVIPHSAQEAEVMTDIQDQFDAAFTASGAPKDAALYANMGQDAMNAVLYFSPRAVGLISGKLNMLQALDCERPSSDSVTLLIGNDYARDTGVIAD